MFDFHLRPLAQNRNYSNKIIEIQKKENIYVRPRELKSHSVINMNVFNYFMWWRKFFYSGID